ncbi:S1 family peptidase [Allokutzneria albata]|uniref:Trypsin n=1 Tax=Allokutzneria albata TaxID=211114 RepID=A0A1H0ADU5_ALLAB|nr:serine protease [Allokutzneria albata]SDN31577.1 Trypsin [Allokutzneria albata]
MRKPLVLGLLVAAVAVVGAAPAGAVVGGTKADQPYPFMVSLQNPQAPGGKHFCGASVLAPRWLLTAAHCVDNAGNVAKTTVRVGSDRSDAGGRIVKLEKVVLHPDYIRNGPAGAHADIALVHLVDPVDLPAIPVAATPGEGSAVRAIGWGRTCAKETEVNCPLPSPSLKQLEMKVVEPKSCDRMSTGDTCLNSVEAGGAVCFADSGSPLLVKAGTGWRIAGVASRFGAPDGTDSCDSPTSIYTDAHAVRDWIATTAGMPVQRSTRSGFGNGSEALSPRYR